MSWKNWEIDLTLLRYCGEWYYTTDDLRQGRSILQYFDTVVEVNGDSFNVIKDRTAGFTGEGEFGALLRMQLFTQGLSFWDLPEFTKHSAFVPTPTVIGFKDNGDLFEYPEPTRTM